MIDLQKKIYVLDGAMGTMIQRFGLDEDDYHTGPFAACAKELKGNSECLNLTRPEVIRKIHKEYIGGRFSRLETQSTVPSVMSVQTESPVHITRMLG